MNTMTRGVFRMNLVNKRIFRMKLSYFGSGGHGHGAHSEGGHDDHGHGDHHEITGEVDLNKVYVNINSDVF